MRDELDRAQHARSMDALATSSKHFAATEERPRIAVTDTVLMRAARDFSLACEAPIRGMLHEPTGYHVIGWLESDIEEWIQKHVDASRAAAGGGVQS